MLSNFGIEMQSLISGYTYAEGQTCSGRWLGSESTLQSAQAACDTNEECACIYDMYCDGSNWYMHAGRSTVSSSDCSWTQPGSLI